MFLCIYRRGKKYYSQCVKKLTESFTVVNEHMEAVKLGYKQKIASFAFNGWEDFKRIKKYLQVNFGLKIFILQIRAADKTFEKLFIELMKNPFYELILAEKEEKNEVYEEESANCKAYLIENYSDWKAAQKEFEFESDFYKNILTAEELPN